MLEIMGYTITTTIVYFLDYHFVFSLGYLGCMSNDTKVNFGQMWPLRWWKYVQYFGN